MQTFVVLGLLAVASAAQLGYNYGPGASIGGSSGEYSVGGGIGGSASNGFASSGGFGGSGGYHGAASGSNEQFIDAGLNKEYYIYSAPEEEHHEGQASQEVINTIKRNLRVVFIKAPEHSGANRAALNIARQATEDRTAIYVLTKQPDVSELINEVQQTQNTISHKPEVRFVKYRTAQDAINAQQAIQHQYDALGGTAHTSNEGVAPVLNYASAGHASGHGIGVGSSLGGGRSGFGSLGAGSSLGGAVADFGDTGSSSNVNAGIIAAGERSTYLPANV